MMKTVFALGLAAILGARAAAAAPLPPGGVTAEEMSKALTDKGYRATLLKTPDSYRQIESSTRGLRFWIILKDCKAERCRTVDFFIDYAPSKDHPISVEMLSDYNRRHSFGYATVETDGAPRLDADVSAVGVTTEYLADVIDWWDVCVGQFDGFVGG